MSQTGYFKQAWGLLTRDKGWFKPLLVMAAADCVPIVGFLGNQGYALEWARLTAWGVDASPKQKNVQVGQCIASGFRAFVVALGMGLCVALAFGVLNGIANVFPDAIATVFVALIGLVQTAFSLFYGVFGTICMIRCSIYESIGAGYRVDRVFQMVKRETSGFCRLVLINFVMGFVFSMVMFVLAMLAMVSFLPLILAAVNDASEYAVITAVSQSIGGIVVTCILCGFVLCIAGNLYNMLSFTCTALWMREFDVASWGKSSDPLPGPGVHTSSADNYTRAAGSATDARDDVSTSGAQAVTTPANPGNPGNLANPVTPANPGNLANPVTPANPGNLANSVTPANPTAPTAATPVASTNPVAGGFGAGSKSESVATSASAASAVAANPATPAGTITNPYDAHIGDSGSAMESTPVRQDSFDIRGQHRQNGNDMQFGNEALINTAKQLAASVGPVYDDVEFDPDPDTTYVPEPDDVSSKAIDSDTSDHGATTPDVDALYEQLNSVIHRDEK